jgi:hypothetical protein
MDTICNVRIHGETKKQPRELFAREKTSLQPLPANTYDIGVVKQVRANAQFRISVDANRYSVPAQYAGAALTMKLYPDRICFYHQEQLIARHVRSYDRHQDFEDPDHPKPLLAQRRKAKNQLIIKRFMMLSPQAVDYYQALENKRMNPLVHARKIVALSEIHGIEPVRRALEDAFSFQAFSSEYIANILEQQKNVPVRPAALQLTRREDLLDLEIQAPDMTIYERNIS